MVEWDASSRAAIADSRTGRVRRQPDLRGAGQPRRLPPEARRSPTPRSPRRWSASSRASRPTSPTSRNGTGRASRPAAPRPPSRCGRPSSSSTTGSRPRSPRTRCSPCRTRPTGVDAAALARAPAGRRAEARAAGRRALPRRAPRRGRAAKARPDERCGLTHLPDGEEVYAKLGALLHDHRQVTAGDPRDRAAAGGQARGGVRRARGRGGRHLRRAGGVRGAARRPGAAPHQRRRDRRGLEGRDGQGAGGDGRLVRPAAAVRLRRRAHHERRDRLLLRAGRRTAAAAASSS